jgi:hypothetical protein
VVQPWLRFHIPLIEPDNTHGAATLPTVGMIHYRQGAEARRAWGIRPTEQNAREKSLVAIMNEGGFVPQMTEQLKIKAKRQLAEAFQTIKRGEGGPADYRRFVSALLRRPIEALQAPIFEKWIPALKTAAYSTNTPRSCGAIPLTSMTKASAGSPPARSPRQSMTATAK